MIDIENEIFSIMRAALKKKYPKLKMFITGEYVKVPPTFPCVSIVESDNQIYRNTRTFENVENHVQVMYEVNVYSNKDEGKKSQCKELISCIDEKFAELGFTRTMLSPIPNEEDTTVYRMVGRYRAIVSKEKVIYRR